MYKQQQNQYYKQLPKNQQQTPINYQKRFSADQKPIFTPSKRQSNPQNRIYTPQNRTTQPIQNEKKEKKNEDSFPFFQMSIKQSVVEYPKKEKQESQLLGKIGFQIMFEFLVMVFNVLLFFLQIKVGIIRGENQLGETYLIFILGLSLLYQRVISFRLDLIIKKYIKRKSNLDKNNYVPTEDQDQLSEYEKISSIFQVITFTELLSFFKVLKVSNGNSKKGSQKKNGKQSMAQQFLFEKNVSDLAVYHIVFFLSGLYFLLNKIMLQEKLNPILIISVAFSFISILKNYLQIYYNRIQKAYKYKEKDFIEFRDKFPEELKLYLADPMTQHLLKFHVNANRDTFSEHFRIQNPQKNKENVLSLFKKIMIALYIFVYVSTWSGLFVLSYISEERIRLSILFLSGYLMYIPNQAYYLKLQLKYSTALEIWPILKYFLKQIKISILGFLTYLSPIVNQDIPCISGSKQVWYYNFDDPIYVMMVQQALQIYFVTLIDGTVKGESDIIESLSENSSAVESITSKDSFFRQIVRVVFFMFVVNLGLFIMYCVYRIYNFYNKFYNKNGGQKKKKEQPVTIQDVQSSKRKLAEKKRDLKPLKITNNSKHKAKQEIQADFSFCQKSENIEEENTAYLTTQYSFKNVKTLNDIKNEDPTDIKMMTSPENQNNNNKNASSQPMTISQYSFSVKASNLFV